MAEKTFQPGENYYYPLIIKKLLNDALIKSPNREIVYADKHRYTYQELNSRIARLANGLTELGAATGDTIAVFDYDSHRYLECFFAIPMIGGVLQTVNWRLSAEQIAYTINHAEARIIIINADFLPILDELFNQLKTVKTVVVITENEAATDMKIEPAAEFEHAGGAVRVRSARELGEAVASIVGDRGLAARLVERAGKVLATNRGAVERSLELVLETFDIATTPAIEGGS